MKISDENGLAEAIATSTGRLRITGGGTRALGNPVDGDDLSVAGLTGISLYEPGALTLVAKAGTPVDEIETLLTSEGQRLAFEPMDHRGLSGQLGPPTIGGVVAANVSGPRRIAVGACRDFLLGVRFVDGMGRVLKNGGRVMKNVTGYDLVKLMAGSFGSLGVISEVSLKVLPEPETRAVLLIEGLDDTRAIAALSAALSAPYDVTGAAHVVAGLDGAPMTMIRLEGFEASVKYRAERLRDELSRFGAGQIETDPDKTAAGWAWLRDLEAFHGKSGDVWRISVKPSDGPRVGARLQPLGAEVIYDWGGGLVWALVPEGSDVRQAVAGIAGHARIERASAETRLRLGAFPLTGVVLDKVAADLRHKFDPRGILNPGIMG